MEKVNLPHIDGIIGLPSEKGERSAWLKHIRDVLKDGGRRIEDWEIPKTKRDREIITFVQEIVWSYLESFGRTKRIRVPLRNIHLLKVGGTRASSGGAFVDGVQTDVSGSVRVDRFEDDTRFALVIFHELYHLGAFQVLRVFHGSTVQRVTGWRQGVSSSGGAGRKKYLKWGEEAVVEHMTHRFYKEYLRARPDFSKWKGPLILNRQGELDDLKGIARLARTIGKRRRRKIKNSTRVIHLFCVAQSTGHWLPIARLIRDVFDDRQFFRKMAQWKGR